MDTRNFTAALVALALLTSCSPGAGSSGPAGTSAPQTQGPGQGQNPGANPGGPTGAPAGAPGGGAPGGEMGPGGRGSGTPGNSRQAPVTVQVEVVNAGTLWVDNTTAGAVIAETQSTVAAGASGTVKSILRQVGDWVEAGTPVIQLDDTQLKLSARLAQATLDNAKISAGVTDGPSTGPSKLALQVQSAQSALASAQKNYASAQALMKVGGISGSDLDNAQTQLQNAQANLESARMSLAQSGIQVETASIQLQQAQLNLANATIKAPYTGQISAINLHPGEYVGTSTAAFSLVSRAKVISFGVSPSEAPGLTLGSPVTFTIGGKKATTRITQAPSAPVNGLVPLMAALPSSLEAPLGTVGTLSYRLAAAEGVLVPLPALQSAENKTFVYTADQGKARRHEVTVLGDSGTYTAVSGLAPGSTVILSPPPGLLIGGAVKPVPTTGSGAPTSAPLASESKAGSRAKAPAPGAQGDWSQKRAAGEGAASAGQAEGQGSGTLMGQRRRPTGEAGTTPGANVEAGAGPQAAPGNFQGQRRRPTAEGAPAGGSAPTTGGQ